MFEYCTPKDWGNYKELLAIQEDCLSRSNMSELEAWEFARRCVELGYDTKITNARMVRLR